MKSGCGWLFAIGLCGLAIMAALLVKLPAILPEGGGQPVYMGRATPTPSTSTVTVQTIHGPKERPAWMVGAWFATGLMVLFAAGQVKKSASAAKRVGVPGAGCGEALAVIAVGIVTVIFFLAGVLATIGGN